MQSRGSEATGAVSFPVGQKVLFIMRPFLEYRQEGLFIPGCVQGANSYSLSVCLCVRITFVVWTDCESHTRPISTTARSTAADAYGLMRGTCFFAYRLEVIVITGLLWISWCVLCADVFFVFFDCFCLRTHTACCTYKAALPHLHLYYCRGAYRVTISNRSVCCVRNNRAFDCFSTGARGLFPRT